MKGDIILLMIIANSIRYNQTIDGGRIMNYLSLAEELVLLRNTSQHIQLDREISKSAQADMFILAYLKKHDNKAYPKDLSNSFMVSTARMAVILNRLEDKGYIERTTDTKDNRYIVVSISKLGLEILKNFHEKSVEYMASVLEELGPEDAAEYVRLKKKLINISLSKLIK